MSQNELRVRQAEPADASGPAGSETASGRTN